MRTTTVQAADSRRDLLSLISARARNLVGQFRGTGLGRTGVHHIVTQHGGMIVVKSKIGIGTTPTVRLPLEVSPR